MNKIINGRATVTMYISMVTVARVEIYTILEALMWSIFESKCVKIAVFCILQDYPQTDVDALRASKYCQAHLEKGFHGHYR